MYSIITKTLVDGSN